MVYVTVLFVGVHQQLKHRRVTIKLKLRIHTFKKIKNRHIPSQIINDKLLFVINVVTKSIFTVQYKTMKAVHFFFPFFSFQLRRC